MTRKNVGLALGLVGLALVGCSSNGREEGHASTHSALEGAGEDTADHEAPQDAPQDAKSGWFEGSCRAEAQYDFEKDEPYGEVVSSSCGWGWGGGIVYGDPFVECLCRCK
jgi:hypothetical protein